MKEYDNFWYKWFSSAGIYLLKVINRNTRTGCEICSKLAKIFIVNFEHISYLNLVFLLLTLNMELPAGSQIKDNYISKKRNSQKTFYITRPYDFYMQSIRKWFIVAGNRPIYLPHLRTSGRGEFRTLRNVYDGAFCKNS